MATVSGWWEPVSETEITSRQWAEMRESIRVATEQGKAMVTAAGVSLVWHPAPDSLDAAWAEAEAALPEGLWSIEVVKTVGASSGPYMAGTTFGPPALGYAYANTPAAALRALAAQLREVGR